MSHIYIYILLITFLFSHNRHSNIPVTLIQPDNSIINCFISGDEYYHWFHDENNYTIIQSNKDGYYYYAIEEFNEIKVSQYSANVINPAFIGLTPNIKINRQFDIITFRGTIEHFKDPKSYLYKAIDLLNDRGLIFITSTPNSKSICCKIFKEKWNQHVPEEHLFHFSSDHFDDFFCCGSR